MMTAIVALLIGTSAKAIGIPGAGQMVHQAQCITPRANPGAPVGVLYAHGWFEKRGSSGYVKLEEDNRKKWQEYADYYNVAVAVPVSEVVNGKGYRTWGRRTPEETLAAMKDLARFACGGRPTVEGLMLVGFSDGGYATRRIALNCVARKPEFAAVVMMGAKPSSATSKVAYRQDCAPLIAIRGKGDGSTDPQGGFYPAAKAMIASIGGNGVVAEPYKGKHEVPNLDDLIYLTELAKPGFLRIANPPVRVTNQGGWM
ncbi:MAG: hypothetical protein C5B49_05340 [Bdellovibrio sp.]|nr:MAG: hypothetical protein C5B49_05340 [Bdellovibrio sp.]